MTGFLHEKEFSRKTFVKGGGVMIVGFSLAGAGLLPGKAQYGAAHQGGAVTVLFDPLKPRRALVYELCAYRVLDRV